MKFNFKQFKKIFISTVLLFSVAFLALNIYTNVNYYSQFTSKEKIDQYFANNEIIPNGTKMLGVGGETVVFLTTPGAGTWTVPDDCQEATIEVIGGGGSGGPYNSNKSGGGAGGGAYSKKNSLALTPGSSVSYSVGQYVYFGSGTDTWFGAATFAESPVAAKGGGVGGYMGGSGIGGQASLGIGDVKYSGGNGAAGGIFGSNNAGGGAAGPQGDGGNANLNTGGTGGAGFGGIGGTSLIDGGNGTEWDATHGSGGGGGGGVGGGAFYSAGYYGGGGGGQTSNGGMARGTQGIIVITYTPASSGSFNFFLFF